MHLLVDTNLIIRALLSPGPARQFFNHQVLYHSEQLAALREVAGRPRLNIATQAVTELIDRFERYGRQIESDLDVIVECRDPKDNYVLAISLAGEADMILTEDEDLLVLNPWRGVRITRLFQFLNEHPLPQP